MAYAGWSDEPVRDVGWCEAEIQAGRAITNQRIHLSRPIRNYRQTGIFGCSISVDFNASIIEGDESYNQLPFPPDFKFLNIQKAERLVAMGLMPTPTPKDADPDPDGLPPVVPTPLVPSEPEPDPDPDGLPPVCPVSTHA